MATLSEFIETGMAYFRGSLVPAAQLEQARSEVALAEGRAKSFEGTIDSLTAKVTELESRLAAQTDAMQKATADNVRLTAEAQSATERAADLVAAQQIPVGCLPGGPSAGDNSLAAQLEAIKDPVERTRFFRKNSSALRAASHAERSNTQK